MTVTEQAFDIPPATLFAIIVDPASYPVWLVGTEKICEVSADWPAPGSFFKHRVGLGPIAIPDRTTARDIESPLMFELLVRARPVIEAIVRFDIAGTSGGCKLRMLETPVGIYRLVAPITQPLIRARNERSLQRLHDFVRQFAGHR